MRLSWLVSVIAPDLAIGFGRNRHFQVRLDLAVDTADLDLVGGEDDLVGVRQHREGLIAGGPEPAIAQVADIAKLAPVIAGAVFAPAGDVDGGSEGARLRRLGPAPAPAAAGIGHHDRVVAVGEQVRARVGSVRVS